MQTEYDVISSQTEYDKINSREMQQKECLLKKKIKSWKYFHRASTNILSFFRAHLQRLSMHSEWILHRDGSPLWRCESLRRRIWWGHFHPLCQ